MDELTGLNWLKRLDPGVIELLSWRDTLHNQMKRLVVTGPKQAEFQDVPVPVCPDDGLLVRAEVTALSTGTEIRTYRGTPVDSDGQLLYPSGVPLTFPYETGYSMVGRVAEVGAGATGFSVGDRVFVGEPHKEYAAVAAAQAFKLTEGLPTEQAAFLNVMTIGQLALRKGNPRPGENVAIVGLGVVGLSVLAFCRSFGFRTMAIDTDDRRLEVATAMGADVAISSDAAGLQEAVVGWSAGRGADLAIEAATAWPAIKTGMDVVRPGGKVVVVATHTDTPDFSPVSYPYNVKDVALLTSFYPDPNDDRWDKSACMSLSAELLDRRELDIAPMLTHEVEWSEMPEVYRRLDEGDGSLLGVVVRWPGR